MPFESAAQSRKCYALRARGQAGSWDCSEWSQHTDYSRLPKRKRKKKQEKASGELPTGLTARQAVKAAFLLRCARAGLTSPTELVKAAGDLRDAFGAATGLTGTYLDLLMAAGIGLPVAGGFGLGHVAGKLHNAGEQADTENLRTQSLLQAYRRLSEDARTRAAVNRTDAARRGRIVPVG